MMRPRTRRKVIVVGVLLGLSVVGIQVWGAFFGPRIVESVPSPRQEMLAYAERQGGWPWSEPEYRIYLRSTPPTTSWRGPIYRIANALFLRAPSPVFIGRASGETPVLTWHQWSAIQVETSEDYTPAAGSVVVDGQRIVVSFSQLHMREPER